MFYMKDQQGNFIQMSGEFYAQCPECEKLHPVEDIVDIIRDCPDFDPYSTSIYCEDCTRKRMKNN